MEWLTAKTRKEGSGEMVILKKIKGATLIETIVASVVIMTAFVFATMIINNVFYTAVVNDTFSYKNRIKEVHYLAKHGKLEIPYFEETNEWEITVESKNDLIFLFGNFKQNKLSTSIKIPND